MQWQTVSDPSDPRLEGFRDLRDPELRRSREAAAGVFVAEGVTVVGRLARSPYRVLAVAAVPEQRSTVTAELEGCSLAGGAALLEVPRPVLDAVAGFPVHRGVLALGARRPLTALDELAAEARTLVVLEDCNDHENLGAIARAARALHADGLVLTPRCADPLYRRSVRVSMGHILCLPIHASGPWPAALDTLRSQRFTVLALTPAADAVDLERVAVGPDDKVALLLGAEGPGLTAAALAGSDLRVRIPIRGDVDSLNVGHAAAVALHHLAANRRLSG